jgi:RNA polymerase sigma factor (sigma-70 family)
MPGRPPPFDHVVNRHGDDVWRFAVSQVGPSRAEEVFQETMVAALAAYPALRDPAAVRPWLLRIAARKAIDTFRTAARHPVPIADPEPAAKTADPEPPDEELWERVRALPTKQRQAVALRFVVDLDYRAIGSVMETTAAAARRNVFEGLTVLRRQYVDSGADAPRTQKV